MELVQKKNDPKKLNSEISNNDWETKDALKSSVFRDKTCFFIDSSYLL